MTNSKLKSPYPYFGGKSKVAPIIWSAFGEVSNYVEPFGGSLAVLLASPKVSKIETVNDLDCFIANFWRAISNNYQEVVKYADYPVNETDLHARHRWLVSSATDDFRQKMNVDPDFYDAKIAGYWVWGMGASIPGNWLLNKGLNAMPLLSSAGGGIHGLTYSIEEWFKKLQERTRRVRVCCGDWKKLISPVVLYKNKGLSNKDITAVFLDPPYDFSGRSKVYKEENNTFKDVCHWAIENGEIPNLKIAVCGYEGSANFPPSWQEYSWQTNGGMANQATGDSQGKSNKNKEMIYFSPFCNKIK